IPERNTPFCICCSCSTLAIPANRFALFFNRITTILSKRPVNAYASGTELLFGLVSSFGSGDGFVTDLRVSCAHNTPAVARTAVSSSTLRLLVILSILSCRHRILWQGCLHFPVHCPPE